MTVAFLIMVVMIVLSWKALVFLGGSVIAVFRGTSLEAGKDTFKKVLGFFIVVMIILAVIL